MINTEKVQYLTPVTEGEEMRKGLLEGRTKGTTTYIDLIDPRWKWRQKEVDLLTGYANEGKSTKWKQLCLIKALEERKKFVFHVPEDAPASEFFDDAIHTISGQSTDKDNPNCISMELYEHCMKLIEDLFIVLYIKPPFNTIEEIVSSTMEVMEINNVYGLIIDPYIKVTRSAKAPDRDDLYGAYFLNILSDFAKTYDAVATMVMHQQTPKLQDTTKMYPKPNMYAIKSGGTFADTADNVLSLWRPKYAQDKIDPLCVFSSEKIKKQKLVGVPGEVEMNFCRKQNRYCYKDTFEPLYNWNKWLPNYKRKIYV